MSGTKEGGRKAAIINKQRHGADFYQRIGARGGRKSIGGFSVDVPCECKLIAGEHFIRNCAGKRGGATSRRGKARE